MVNQVVLAVGLGLVTGVVVVAVYLLVQYVRHRCSSENYKYSQLPTDPTFRSRAIVKQDIPSFYIPQPVPILQQQPIAGLERTDSIKKEEYRNGRTHLSPTVHSVDVRKKPDERCGIKLDAINTGALSSPQLATKTPQTPRKISTGGKKSVGSAQESPAPQHRKVAVFQKKPGANLGKLEFSLYYDQSFRLLQMEITRGVKIPSPEADTPPEVLAVASLTFEESQIWEQKTRPASKSNDPQFNEKFEAHNIISAKLRASTLHFQLFDDRTQKLIGEVNYPLKELPPNKLTNQILPLVPLELEESECNLSEEAGADLSAGLGELSISLCHNPTDQKLVVKVNGARGLQPIAHGRLNPFVKLDVTFCGRKLSSRSTKTAQNTLVPDFSEVFVFDMHTDKLPQVTLLFKVKHRSRMRDISIGSVHLGYCVHVESEYKHWEQVMEKPHLEIEQWHAIQEQFVE